MRSATYTKKNENVFLTTFNYNFAKYMVELLSVTGGNKCEKMRNKKCHFVFVASPLGPALRPKLPTSFSEDEASNLRS